MEKLKEVKIGFISTEEEVTLKNVCDSYFVDHGNNIFFVIKLNDGKNTVVMYNAKDIDNIWEEDMNDEA